MTGTPDVSVAVATHNRRELLAQLLDSLKAQTLPSQRFEVVVVDDGSSDGTPELLAEALESGELSLQVIRREHAEGPATARNVAWRAASAPVVAFTDDDCTPVPGWLEAGLAACTSQPDAIVQGRTDPRPDQLHLISPFSRTQIVHAVGPLYETCNIFYPRALLEELDGFAADTYALPAGEDTDLAWRALERGVPTRYEPEALVHHEVLVAGPVGMLRNAVRWHTAIPVFARHPKLRREHLHRGIFWSETHEQLLRFLAGLAVARRSRLLALILCRPYLIRLVRRRSGPVLAPYILLVDIVELASVLRGAFRSRIMVL